MKFVLKVLRGEPGTQRWEEFELALEPSMNVISALLEVRQNPINSKGEKVLPISFEQGCLEEVCGSCSMLVNGRPRQACTALIDALIEANGPVVTLAPLTKFPLVRDLVVDRTIMFEQLKKVRAWVDMDGSQDLGAGPKISPKVQEVMYTLSTCMTCGCCSESCPQVNSHSAFIGPAPISQARFFNMHPVGDKDKEKRLHTLMEKGGVSDCGSAQNCEKVCPKKIPLTTSIAVMSREVTQQAFKDLFGLSENEQ